jgi:hypothetical protein
MGSLTRSRSGAPATRVPSQARSSRSSSRTASRCCVSRARLLSESQAPTTAHPTTPAPHAEGKAKGPINAHDTPNAGHPKVPHDDAAHCPGTGKAAQWRTALESSLTPDEQAKIIDGTTAQNRSERLSMFRDKLVAKLLRAEAEHARPRAEVLDGVKIWLSWSFGGRIRRPILGDSDGRRVGDGVSLVSFRAPATLRAEAPAAEPRVGGWRRRRRACRSRRHRGTLAQVRQVRHRPPRSDTIAADFRARSSETSETPSPAEIRDGSWFERAVSAKTRQVRHRPLRARRGPRPGSGRAGAAAPGRARAGQGA